MTRFLFFLMTVNFSAFLVTIASQEALGYITQIEELLNLQTINGITPDDVHFYLCTTQVTNQELDKNVDNTAVFAGAYKVVVIVHGWTSNAFAEWMEEISQEYLQQGGNICVIKVGYPEVASALYNLAVMNLPAVGTMVGEFLVANGIPASKMSLVGHSLGGHCVGFAAKRVYALTGERPAEVVGMDAAGPLYEVTDSTKRLSPDDGVYTVHIRTDKYMFGNFLALGQLTIDVNTGAAFQPGCVDLSPSVTQPLEILNVVSCSHLRGHNFFIRKFWNEIQCRDCPAYLLNVLGLCDSNPAHTFTTGNFNTSYKGICKAVELFN